MRGFFNAIAIWLVHLGGLGLVFVGIADSSFLVAPLANDLLVVTLTAKHPERMFLYAFLAASGSMLGCLILDVVSRKAKEGVEEKVSGKRAEQKVKFVESRIRKHAGWTLAIAAQKSLPRITRPGRDGHERRKRKRWRNHDKIRFPNTIASPPSAANRTNRAPNAIVGQITFR